MELGPYIKGVSRIPIEAVRMPVVFTRNTAERLGDYALHAFDDALEVFMPKQSPEQFVEERIKSHPLDDAQIAHKAIERGERTDDLELLFFARASLIRALKWAYENREAAPQVTEEVAQIVENHNILMPELEPLVPDEDIKPAKKALLLYGKNTVIEVFPKGQDTV